jgi:hypothetical protein
MVWLRRLTPGVRLRYDVEVAIENDRTVSASEIPGFAMGIEACPVRWRMCKRTKTEQRDKEQSTEWPQLLCSRAATPLYGRKYFRMGSRIDTGLFGVGAEQ